MSPTVLTDHADLLGAAGLPTGALSTALYCYLCYLLARLLAPVVLIAIAARGATPAQRTRLVRDYLLGRPPKRSTEGAALMISCLGRATLGLRHMLPQSIFVAAAVPTMLGPVNRTELAKQPLTARQAPKRPRRPSRRS